MDVNFSRRLLAIMANTLDQVGELIEQYSDPEPIPADRVDQAVRLAELARELHADVMAAESTLRFEIPGQPPVGSIVRTLRVVGGSDRDFASPEAWDAFVQAQQWRFQRTAHGSETWMVVATPPSAVDQEMMGWETTWTDMLKRYGSVELVPEETEDPEVVRLYGPRAARWGDPATPCGYAHTLAVGGLDGTRVGCALGLNHAGPHKDAQGVVLARGDHNVVAVSSESFCTCGHPAAHRPDCPRFPSSLAAYGISDPDE